MYTENDIRNAIMKTVKQGEKCEDHGQCLYNGPDNTHCVLGFMFKDNQDIQDFFEEFGQVHSPKSIQSHIECNFGLSIDMLHEIQNDHDFNTNDLPSEIWLGKFNSTLYEYGLKLITMEEVKALE